MKKLTTIFTVLVFALFFTNNTFAQCSISGSSSIPAGQNRAYNVTTQSGAQYFWSTTGGLTIIGSNTSSSVTVRGNSGSGVLYVTRFRSGSAPCCQSRSISVASSGCPTSASISGFVECIGRGRAIIDVSALVNPSNTAGAASYSWTRVSGSGNFVGGTTSQFATLIASSNSSTRVRLTVTCQGNSFSVERTFFVGNCNGIPLETPRLAPNPANSSVQIKLGSADTKTQDYEVEVINQLGEVVMRQKMTVLDSKLNISKLKEGTYFVRTRVNGRISGNTRLLKK